MHNVHCRTDNDSVSKSRFEVSGERYTFTDAFLATTMGGSLSRSLGYHCGVLKYIAIPSSGERRGSITTEDAGIR